MAAALDTKRLPGASLLVSLLLAAALAACGGGGGGDDDDGPDEPMPDAGPGCVPTAELCDGLDNDCDGQVDEALVRTCGSDVGVCTAGTETCTAAGAWGACIGLVGPVVETCNGQDDDCDGVGDEGCPAAVTARSPWNGFTTGSVHATAGALAVQPRRPTFRWNTVSGASSYQLVVDDSCVVPGFASCAFASPELTLEVAGPATVVTVPADLPVATTVPVGTRYFWRVRACNAQGCGPFSAVRYLDVGRLSNDVNGDGHADVLVGAPERGDPASPQPGRVELFLGGPGAAFDPASDASLAPPAGEREFGTALTIAGDLNGDGFADLVISTSRSETDGDGRAFVYFGGPGTSVGDAPAGVLAGPAPVGIRFFGHSLDGPGDVNGDGFADVIVGAPIDGDGAAYLYLGAPGTTFDTTSDAKLSALAGGEDFGAEVAGAGDVNGDGFPDLLVGEPKNDLPASRIGKAYLFLGGAGVFNLVADATFVGEAEEDRLGDVLASAGDVNGDGFSDLLLGVPRNDAGGASAGRAFLYLGNAAASFGAAAAATFTGTAGAGLGFAMASAGDVNADGFDDIMISAVSVQRAGTSAIYFGGPGLGFDTALDGSLSSGTSTDFFGGAVAGAGDVNGDGHADLVVGAPYDGGGGVAAGQAYVFLGAAAATFDATADATMTCVAAGTMFGQTVD